MVSDQVTSPVVIDTYDSPPFQACDSKKPTCTQCLRGRRHEDCEYTNLGGESRIQALEYSIARRQARIYELENADSCTEELVILTQPYSSGNRQTAKTTDVSLLACEFILKAAFTMVVCVSADRMGFVFSFQC